MPSIRKIHITRAQQLLQNDNRGYDQPPAINLQELKALSNNACLIPISQLRPFFNKPKDFKQFKTLISDNDWLPLSIRPSRSRSRSRSKSPSRSRSRSRSRSLSPPRRSRHGRGRGRDRLKMISALGRLRPKEHSVRGNPSSLLSITPAGDECDSTDVNLPLPVCKGIRHVCRNYGKNRQYQTFEPDSSENHQYEYTIHYNSNLNGGQLSKKKNTQPQNYYTIRQ